MSPNAIAITICAAGIVFGIVVVAILRNAAQVQKPLPKPHRCAGCGTEMYGVVLCLGCGKYLCGRHKPVVNGVHELEWKVKTPLVCSSERGLSLAVEDQTPDDLVSLAAGVDVNPVPTYPEPICRHQWPVPPEGGADHTVPHVCVRLDKHRRHKCACGAWGLEIGVRT